MLKSIKTRLYNNPQTYEFSTSEKTFHLAINNLISITWKSDAGCSLQLPPISTRGQHRLFVCHHGDKGGHVCLVACEPAWQIDCRFTVCAPWPPHEIWEFFFLYLSTIYLHIKYRNQQHLNTYSNTMGRYRQVLRTVITSIVYKPRYINTLILNKHLLFTESLYNHSRFTSLSATSMFPCKSSCLSIIAVCLGCASNILSQKHHMCDLTGY